jgi:hypothetical protein
MFGNQSVIGDRPHPARTDKPKAIKTLRRRHGRTWGQRIMVKRIHRYLGDFDPDPQVDLVNKR